MLRLPGGTECVERIRIGCVLGGSGLSRLARRGWLGWPGIIFDWGRTSDVGCVSV